jgi:hypothetical protein
MTFSAACQIMDELVSSELPILQACAHGLSGMFIAGMQAAACMGISPPWLGALHHFVSRRHWQQVGDKDPAAGMQW